MGLQIFEASGSFSPADHGLHAGDVLDVICVGGGASGAYRYGSTQGSSVAGGASSIGSVSSASGVVMGKGGRTQTKNGVKAPGCGAGGYLPGLPVYGGSGADGWSEVGATGLAGTYAAPNSPWANPYGDGNKGATAGDTATNSDVNAAPGGNGYGAGGGGASDTDTYVTGSNGGDAGKIAYGTIVLSSTDAISVTVGRGGVNTAVSAMHGAPGVVLVFW